MAKRRTISEVASDYIGALLKIDDDPRTDRMIRELWAVLRMGHRIDFLLRERGIKVTASMGQPTKITEDIEWLRRAVRYYRDGDSWETAYGKLANQYGGKEETIKKRVERAKDALGMRYWRWRRLRTSARRP